MVPVDFKSASANEVDHVVPFFAGVLEIGAQG
jgi:hypothetical protein